MHDPWSKLTTACWVIEGDTQLNQAKGASQAFGASNNKDAYRGELYGIYCVLLSAKMICEFNNIQSGMITIACDCDGALLRALTYDQRPNTNTSQFDLIWAIYDLQKDIPITIKTEKVESHLDEKYPNRELT